MNPQFAQLAIDHPDAVINALKHRPEMRVVMARPMLARIALESGVLA